jgi:hypothetical protein
MRALKVLSRGAGVLVVMALVCVMWAAAPALAGRNHSFSGSIGSSGSGAGELSSPQAVAVDGSAGPAAGDVYVADTGNDRVDQFDSSGNFIRAWGWGVADGKEEFETCSTVTTCRKGIQPAEPAHSQPGQFDVPQYIAVDSSAGPSEGDVYVADDGTGFVQKFTSSGELVALWGNGGPGETPNGQLNGANATPTPNPYTTVEGPFKLPFNGITVDTSGKLWVFDRRAFMFEFGQSGAFINSWYSETSAYPVGIAVNSSEDLFFDGSFENIEEFSPAGGLLNKEAFAGEFAGNRPTGLAFNAASNELYVDNSGSSIERIALPCPPSRSVCLEAFGSQQLSGASSVAVAPASETIYVADPSLATIYVYGLEPPSLALVENPTASFVTATSATLQGRIDPHGASTTYRVEYGPTTAYGQSAPNVEEEAGSDFETHEVAIPVQGLAPGSVYHYRIVATNAHGTAHSEDAVFTTQTTGGPLVIADERQWQMVSPPHKNGALFLGAEEPTEAAANGDAFIGLASQPTEDDADGSSGYVNVLMTRSSEGWSSKTISPAHTRDTAQTTGSEFSAFSEDLSHALVSPFGLFTQLSPEASEQTPYLRTNYLEGNVNDYCATGCYQPLVTKNDTAAGVEFGQYNICIAVICGTEFIAATPDLSHVLISSIVTKVQLTSEEAPEGGLYEWSNGTLRLVSQLPAAGYIRTINGGANEERFGTQAISANGERVIVGGYGEGARNPIYVHEMSTGANIKVDEPEGGPGSPGSPQFAGASSDASKVFFIDNGGLTVAGSASGSDLYEYDMDKPAGERLTDLSVDINSGEAANVGAVLGESKDDSYIYFVAGGVLAPGAAPSPCTGASSLAPIVKDCNIYVSHDGVTSFVSGGLNGSVTFARVSPDGDWLSFMSSSDMTGYDTRDAITGEPDQEIYLYSALGKRLICASCDPTKARPTSAHAGGPFAASVPGWAAASQTEAVSYQQRYLSDGGRLFFNSFDALVPQDVDGTEDVYEFEPLGTGRCTASVSTYVETMGGCLGLISSGTSAEESSFVDASESGDDVFFRTEAKLAPQDFDNAMDIYDAHECSAAVPCFPAAPVSPPVCTTGDACKAAPTPQPGLFGPAPSATFSGVGNVAPAAPAPAVKPKPLTRAQKLSRALKACRAKRSPKRRRSCEAAARKRYGTRAGKANSKKKGGR